MSEHEKEYTDTTLKIPADWRRDIPMEAIAHYAKVHNDAGQIISDWLDETGCDGGAPWFQGTSMCDVMNRLVYDALEEVFTEPIVRIAMLMDKDGEGYEIANLFLVRALHQALHQLFVTGFGFGMIFEREHTFGEIQPKVELAEEDEV